MKKLYALVIAFLLSVTLAFPTQPQQTASSNGGGQAVIVDANADGNALVNGYANGTYSGSASFKGNVGLASTVGSNQDSATGASFTVSGSNDILSVASGKVASSSEDIAIALGKNSKAVTSAVVNGYVYESTGNGEAVGGPASYANAGGSQSALASYSAGAEDPHSALAISAASGKAAVNGFTSSFATQTEYSDLAGAATGSSASASALGPDAKAQTAIQGGIGVQTGQNFGDGTFGYTVSNGAYSADTKAGSVSGFTSGFGITTITPLPDGSKVSTFSSATTVVSPAAH